MELKVKVDGAEMSIEEAMSIGTDLGTSPYGFKFDENVFILDPNVDGYILDKI